MARRDAFSELRVSEKVLGNGGSQTPVPSLAQQPLDLIPAAAMKKKRSRQWEKNHRAETVTYRGIPQEILSEVIGLSDSLAVPRDEVVRALLEFSLSRYHDGQLELIAHPKAQRMTLFPENNPDIVSPIPGKSSRQNWLSEAFPMPGKPQKCRARKMVSRDHESPDWQIRVTFRIPASLKEEVRNVAQVFSVGVGEIVWLFIIEGLKSYASGALLLRPAPKTIGKTLFQDGRK